MSTTKRIHNFTIVLQHKFLINRHPHIVNKILVDCNFFVMKRNIWGVLGKLIFLNIHFNIYNTFYIMLINLHSVNNFMQYMGDKFLNIMLCTMKSSFLSFSREFLNSKNPISKVIIDNLVVINIFSYKLILLIRS